MRIGLDISQIVYSGTGVGRFVYGLIDAILKYDKKNEWIFFLSSLRGKVPPDFFDIIDRKNFIRSYLPPSLLSFIWNDLHILAVENFIGNLDWFISSDWTEPPVKSAKKATVVHDLVFRLYPETLPSLIVETQKKRLDWVAKESSIVFVDSRSTAIDLERFYKFEQGRVVVNYPGINREVFLQNEKDENFWSSDSVLDKLDLEEGNFFLTVGKIEPRKNIKRLIEAYEIFSREEVVSSSSKVAKLVVVGQSGWGDLPTSLSEKVVFSGFLSDDDLFALYRNALCFFYPSIYEGFGYPVIEAQLLGCPTAISNTSSLVELGEGGASIFFDPFDTNEIAKKMLEIFLGKFNRTELVARGSRSVERFTWQAYVDRLLVCLNE